MPKKFAGMNSKAAAAKARKEEKAEQEKIRKKQAEDDEFWRDDDKQIQKKKERKEEQERKRLEALEKKREKERLLAEEEANLKAKAGKNAAQPKLTREDIRIRQAQAVVEAAKAAQTSKESEPNFAEDDLPENLNRLQVTENEARNIDEAIQVLGDKPAPVEKHPEKRMKAAYEEFEKVRLPELKAENKNLRLSQLKQILRKEWMKHPSNPLNKNIAAYNTKV